MKKINKYATIVIMLFLVGCESFSSFRYYEYYHHDDDDKLSERQRKLFEDKSGMRKSKEYCVYSLSYFLPINFWDIRFNDKQYIKKVIKDINEDGIKGNNMKNIYVSSSGIGTPIYSDFCIEITGELYE